MPPASGVVLDKMAVEGGRFMAGEALFRIADLSRVWIIADLHEQDLARVQVGQGAQVVLDAWPGRSFAARVGYLYRRWTPPRAAPACAWNWTTPKACCAQDVRPGRARGRRRHPKTVVPVSAIIDDGERRGCARSARPLQAAGGEARRARAEWAEVLEGVEEGERVVVRQLPDRLREPAEGRAGQPDGASRPMPPPAPTPRHPRACVTTPRQAERRSTSGRSLMAMRPSPAVAGA